MTDNNRGQPGEAPRENPTQEGDDNAVNKDTDLPVDTTSQEDFRSNTTKYIDYLKKRAGKYALDARLVRTLAIGFLMVGSADAWVGFSNAEITFSQTFATFLPTYIPTVLYLSIGQILFRVSSDLDRKVQEYDKDIKRAIDTLK